jgi:hypothetical protein
VVQLLMPIALMALYRWHSSWRLGHYSLIAAMIGLA